MTEPACEHCGHWDSRDALVGFCAEITGHLLLDRALGLRGLSTCRTAASGRCALYEPSPEVLEEERSEARHARDLQRCAGLHYPASLNPRAFPGRTTSWPSST
ncbi:hypothetical protein [Fundidesulfovibrio magnetotacticus]|uniref:hypothetical protein n=1 Tax=Fundidesulfovibrio magnetotacticus TaxID=2730080 RepID=UPI0015639A51|nr:hypothetical protein [Fundidesulfovibrio magnetotacticus]